MSNTFSGDTVPQPTKENYADVRRDFTWTVTNDYNFALDTIGTWAEDASRLAMLWVGPDGQEERYTFVHFDEQSSRAAHAFEKLGIQKGDRVLLMLPRVPEWWEAVLGLMKLGAIAIPCTTLLTPKDIQYRAELSEAVAMITDTSGAEKLAQVRAQCPTIRAAVVVDEPGAPCPEGCVGYHPRVESASPVWYDRRTVASDPCMIYFTSGTVGYPKMVLHTHASYPRGHTLVTGRYWLDLRPGDLHWNLSETGWAKFAWSNFFGPWGNGAALFIQDARGKFSGKDTLDMLAKYPITTFCAPPTAYRLLVQEDLKGYQFAALRHCVGAGEPLNPEVIDAWREATGLTIRDGYGQTETVLLCGNFPGVEVRPGSMGFPAPGFDLAIINHDGTELGPNQEGDIAIRVKPNRPLGLFQEYWRNAEAMERSFIGDWYITGDRAYRDADGYFWFVGRADDVIISAGYRIGPFEVESALVEHPDVVEAAVVASPDAVRGEIVKAFVILAPGYTASDQLAIELQDYVKSVTAPYKYPREIEFVTELPKTISGKIRRVELRDRERQRKQGQ
ncbi:MAG: Acetyl-CoA synthetase [Ktedonobacterales bacterium]|jgi:acetyl-CoA synthetase/medium-chain acyl-CoA synthetase|nr:MAG: Acetyl-CoA synthetase [Ktedonobacterales bacterium]